MAEKSDSCKVENYFCSAFKEYGSCASSCSQNENIFICPVAGCTVTSVPGLCGNCGLMKHFSMSHSKRGKEYGEMKSFMGLMKQKIEEMKEVHGVLERTGSDLREFIEGASAQVVAEQQFLSNLIVQLEKEVYIYCQSLSRQVKQECTQVIKQNTKDSVTRMVDTSAKQDEFHDEASHLELLGTQGTVDAQKDNNITNNTKENRPIVEMLEQKKFTDPRSVFSNVMKALSVKIVHNSNEMNLAFHSKEDNTVLASQNFIFSLNAVVSGRGTVVTVPEKKKLIGPLHFSKGLSSEYNKIYAAFYQLKGFMKRDKSNRDMIFDECIAEPALICNNLFIDRDSAIGNVKVTAFSSNILSDDKLQQSLGVSTKAVCESQLETSSSSSATAGVATTIGMIISGEMNDPPTAITDIATKTRTNDEEYARKFTPSECLGSQSTALSTNLKDTESHEETHPRANSAKKVQVILSAKELTILNNIVVDFTKQGEQQQDNDNKAFSLYKTKSPQQESQQCIEPVAMFSGSSKIQNCYFVAREYTEDTDSNNPSKLPLPSVIIDGTISNKILFESLPTSWKISSSINNEYIKNKNIDIFHSDSKSSVTVIVDSSFMVKRTKIISVLRVIQSIFRTLEVTGSGTYINCVAETLIIRKDFEGKFIACVFGRILFEGDNDSTNNWTLIIPKLSSASGANNLIKINTTKLQSVDEDRKDVISDYLDDYRLVWMTIDRNSMINQGTESSTIISTSNENKFTNIKNDPSLLPGALVSVQSLLHASSSDFSKLQQNENRKNRRMTFDYFTELCDSIEDAAANNMDIKQLPFTNAKISFKSISLLATTNKSTNLQQPEDNKELVLNVGVNKHLLESVKIVENFRRSSVAVINTGQNALDFGKALLNSVKPDSYDNYKKNKNTDELSDK